MNTRSAILLFVSALLIAYVQAAWVALPAANQPSAAPRYVFQGSSKISILDTSGYGEYATNKNSPSPWLNYPAIPGGYGFYSMSQGKNGDACIIDDTNLFMYCIVSGTSTWTKITLPAGSTFIFVSIAAYSPNMIVAIDINNDVWRYSGTWTKISSSSNYIWVSVAEDGSIFGITTSQVVNQWNGSGTAWTVLLSGYNIYRMDAGKNALDLAFVSSNSGFPCYKKTSGGVVQIGSGAAHVTVYNDVYFATDNTSIYKWQ